MQRRHFLQTAFLSSLTLPAWALEADNRYRKEIGIQLYTLRKAIAENPATALASVAAAGYAQVEPYGFPDEKAVEMIKIARDLGLGVNSSHFAWQSVTEPEKEGIPPFAKILEQARAAELSHLVIPYLDASARKTADDYHRIAERCNEAATQAATAGIQLAYHNHNFEFAPLEGGSTGYDVFMADFASAMKFELDVFWVKAGGVEPAALLEKLSGRVSQVHLKDLKSGIALPNFEKLPDDAFQELGNGIIPMEPILMAAAAAGVAICHVEQDQSPDAIASIGQSMAHLRSL
jgi:sugar phosphate isomerase/epimerase